jgi:hypothetical protein
MSHGDTFSSRRRSPSVAVNQVKGDIFIDVELFALDLNFRYFSIEKGRITQEVLGGMLDIPFMRPKEFGYEVIESKKRGVTYKNKDTGAMVHDKRLYVAGKRFLLDDVYLMQKLGLRPEKKAKDQQRMYKLAKMITKSANIRPTDNINTIYNQTHNKIRSLQRFVTSNEVMLICPSQPK